jgi:hypothetical protein
MPKHCRANTEVVVNQAERDARYRRRIEHGTARLNALAENMMLIIRPMDCVALFVSVGLAVLRDRLGREALLEYLRSLPDDYADGAPEPPQHHLN